MDCQRLQEHYEAFALGALEGEEHTELRVHLERDCPVCTPGVERARWLVAQLTYLAPPTEPPARVRRQLLAMAVGRTAAGWMPVWAWAVAAVLLAMTLFTTWQARHLEDQVARLRTQTEELAAEADNYRRALKIISDPQTQAIALNATGPVPPVHAYWSESLGLALAARDLPAPASGRTYQLWVVPKDGAPISAGTFHPAASGELLLVSASPAEMARAAALAISDEPFGGSPQPTTQPLWVGPLAR